MDSFATAISLALQHGVPLKVLSEKFAHTRFEPSGWTGNEQIGYAKSIMDYLFRWMQLRFLSGQQLDLFQGLAPAKAVPVAGSIEGEQATVVPSLSAEVYGPRTTPPVEGIAPDPTATGAVPMASYGMEDRGIAKTVHAADAMKSMYDMGDAPSCSTCGAIMVRNGSCYRCMSCGSTSGCS
jgi:ribonucleoside-diphosphate reductase alpha chain